jgi:Lon protease-like protein
MVSTIEAPLFPLHTVLFPGGPLPLRIFEPRYLAMVAECLRADREFGVVLITKGGETGEAAAGHEIGCLARIIDWDQGDDGLLAVRALGTRRFRVLRRWHQPDQLVRAEVGVLPEAAPIPVPERYRAQAEWVAQVLPQLEPYQGIAPQDDAAWLAGRLAELIGIKASQRQTLLETDDPAARLARLASFIDAAG